MPYGSDKNALFPNKNIKSVCFIKNTLRTIILILGDKLIIGKFCAIGEGVEFIMNEANHRINSATTYSFNIMGKGWETDQGRWINHWGK